MANPEPTNSVFGVLSTIVLTCGTIFGGKQFWQWLDKRQKGNESRLREQIRLLEADNERMKQAMAPKHRTEDAIRAIESYGELYRIMEATKDHGGGRCVLYSGHNGGGIPVPGSSYYVTVLQSWIEPALRDSQKTIFKHITVDDYYVRMLSSMTEVGYCLLNTDEMPPCQLRSYAEYDKVRSTLFVSLGYFGERLFFVGVASFESVFSPSEIDRLTTVVFAMREQIALWNSSANTTGRFS